MTHLRVFILLAALLTPAGSALAPQDAPTDPDAGLRAAARLCDLGYLTVPAGLASDQALSAALDAFYAQNGLLGPDANLKKLFLRDAKPAPFPGGGVALPETPLCTGTPMPYEQVRQRLSPGQTYGITDCGTGVVCYLICEELGDRAVMTPSRDWDASALIGLLGEGNPFAKRPVTLTLGGESVAASLEPEPGGESARYGLSFSGGTAGLNGVGDADRDAMLAYAAIAR